VRGERVSHKRKVKRQKVENLFIFERILYKMTGQPVTISPEDERYRTAYRNLFRKSGKYPSDGFYTLKGKKMKPSFFKGTEDDLRIALTVLADSLGMGQ